MLLRRENSQDSDRIRMPAWNGSRWWIAKASCPNGCSVIPQQPVKHNKKKQKQLPDVFLCLLATVCCSTLFDVHHTHLTTWTWPIKHVLLEHYTIQWITTGVYLGSQSLGQSKGGKEMDEMED